MTWFHPFPVLCPLVPDSEFPWEDRQSDWLNLGSYTHALADWQPFVESLEMGVGSCPKEIWDALTKRRRKGCWAGKTNISITSVYNKRNKLSQKVVRSPSLDVFQTDWMSTWWQSCQRIWHLMRFDLYHLSIPLKPEILCFYFWGEKLRPHFYSQRTSQSLLFRSQPESNSVLSRPLYLISLSSCLFPSIFLALLILLTWQFEDSKRILKRPVSGVSLQSASRIQSL